MRKLILGTVLFASTLIASDITVEVTNLQNKNGEVSIGLYNKNDDTFATPKSYRGVRMAIKNNKKVVYTFKNVPNGTYAIAVSHDENKNGKLDKNFWGIPKEGYAFSNNIRPAFRGASFDESKFKVKGNKKIVIRMGYFGTDILKNFI